MSLAHHYPEFGSALPPHPAAMADEADPLEEAQLTGFEEGFKAGWEDATGALATEEQQAIAEISQRLQDMSFTYQEAQGKLVQAFTPLLSDLISKVLPHSAKAALAPHLAEQIGICLRDQSEGVIALTLAPDQVPAIRDALQNQLSIPFAIAEDTSLSTGQAYLRVNQMECLVDLDGLNADIAQAMGAFVDLAKQEYSRHD